MLNTVEQGAPPRPGQGLFLQYAVPLLSLLRSRLAISSGLQQLVIWAGSISVVVLI